jgi:23S rRNA pseudouridine1911/1915/1917 synthase
VPHRLDRPASGAIVFAKDRKAARFLAEQFQRREVKKTYWALVAGRVEPDSGTWMDWMRKIPDEPRSEICNESDEGSQNAVLHYRRIKSSNQLSVLEIILETGRSHQIRLQTSTRGYPIVGDEMYGSSMAFGPQTDDTRKRGIALHARSLLVVDPQSKLPVECLAAAPDGWALASGLLD